MLLASDVEDTGSAGEGSYVWGDDSEADGSRRGDGDGGTSIPGIGVDVDGVASVGTRAADDSTCFVLVLCVCDEVGEFSDAAEPGDCGDEGELWGVADVESAM